MKSILLVEDEENIADMLRGFLERDGFRVFHAFTGEETLERLAEGLAAARDRERQFLLSVSHDLRTPLTTITGYAEALEDGVGDDSEVRRIAGVMGVEGRRLRRLIEDVMVLARLESADFDLRPELVEVAPFLDEILTPYRDRAADLRVSWRQDLTRLANPGFAGGLQRPASPQFAEIDLDRVAQLVGNLVENALRFTPEAGEVSVEASLDDGELVIVVADTGPGIDPDDLPHVFDRFYVARKYRSVRPEGSGLGLSIARQLVDAMDGTIEARTSETSGTTFAVRLPARNR